MSRFDQPSEPDFDRYEPKPIDDVDVPDFDQPDPPVDPAEHAAHAAVEAMLAFRREIERATEFDRVMLLWKMVRAIEVEAAELVNVAAARCDAIVERRR